MAWAIALVHSQVQEGGEAVSADDKAAAAWDDYVSQQQEEKIEQLERELNAANERIKRLESVENSHADVLKAIDNWMKQQEAKEAKL